jgi:hypothetical protein
MAEIRATYLLIEIRNFDAALCVISSSNKESAGPAVLIAYTADFLPSSTWRM